MIAAQFSGAMWYPNCYEYPADVMRDKVATVRDGLLDTLARKVKLSGATWYLPSAGPACFLDPALDQFNDPDSTIFPKWEDVAEQFSALCPGIDIARLFPRDTIHVAVDHSVRVDPFADSSETRLDVHREDRRPEWEGFYAGDVQSVTGEEIDAYFAHLEQSNRRFLADFSRTIHLVIARPGVDDEVHVLRFGAARSSDDAPSYTIEIAERLLRSIIDGRVGWEEVLLSMRVGLRRDPDVFDLQLMSLLRYGNNPVQTRQMVREQSNNEMIVREGVSIQRFCPHAGEDLTTAVVCDGVIECPRHHWKWILTTGECIDGGTVPAVSAVP